MIKSSFLQNDNIELLWDIITDVEIFKNKSNQIKNEIREIFLNNIQGFYKMEENNNISLIDINKKYILLIFNYISNLFSPQKQNVVPQNNKIKIYDELLDNKKALITFEDIQNDRTTQFEKDLNKYKEDFNDSMSLPIPPVPNFADNSKDLPINEMEKMIKEMTDKRNYDIEQINRNISVSNADNWLKSKETSVKSEKYQPTQQKLFDNNNNNNSGLKQIKIENTELDTNVYKNQIIDLNTLQEGSKKNVTWGENVTLEIAADNEMFIDETNLFKKLKKISPIESFETLNNKEININTHEEILLLKKEVTELNTKVEMLNNFSSKIEILDNNINTILNLLKNKNDI